jgi:catechol 2,3-dioxygenase-like lactoylglutathione lyase family enzyme
MTTAALTRGVHHIGLTVPQLAQTRAFFVDALGYQQVGEVPEYPAVFLCDGNTMITLWQVENPDSAAAFDRKRVIGLHHMALLVENHAELAKLAERLSATANVEIEFSPEPLGSGGVRHMMTTIPGGIRVEFLSPGE